MTGILDCLLRNCFTTENDDEDENNIESTTDSPVPHLVSLDRYGRGSASTYRPPDRHSLNSNDGPGDGEGNDEQGNEQHRPLYPSSVATATASETPTSQDDPNQISHLFQRIRSNLTLDRLNNFTNPLHKPNPTPTPEISRSEMLAKVSATLSTTRPSPTYQPAHHFTTQSRASSGDIPSLASHSEIVLPGSDLQKLMSESLRDKGYGEAVEDECVVCMEGFSESNPRMPTRCGCGVDRTYFHLPCLYRWVEWGEAGEGAGGRGECPSCREVLEWEEFGIE